MIIFDEKYSWDGTKRGSKQPVSWWPGAYWLKIVDLSQNNENIHMLRPIIIFAAETDSGSCVRNRYQDLVRNVCRDFNLQIEKILWVAYNADSPDEVEVAAFESIMTMGSEVLFSVRWRSILPNEEIAIRPYFPDNKKTKTNMEEKIITLTSYRCPCGYLYDPDKGDPQRKIPPGRMFEDLPEDWTCPWCGYEKKYFSMGNSNQ